MRKYTEISLTVTICILLSACGSRNVQPTAISPNATETPSILESSTATALPVPSRTPLPTFPPYSSEKEIILNYSFGGEHDSFDMVLGVTHSKIVLYSDGQLIISGNPYREKQLSVDEVNWLFSQLELMGFFAIESNQQHDPTDQLYDFGSQYQKVYDGTYICITASYRQERKLCTYEHYEEFLKPPFKKMLDFMDHYEPNNLSTYQPDRLLLNIEPGRVGFIDENIKSTPWLANFPSLKTDHWKILEVDGKAANEVFDFFDNSQGFRVVDEDGKEYTVYARPLLPHETPSWS